MKADGAEMNKGRYSMKRFVCIVLILMALCGSARAEDAAENIAWSIRIDSITMTIRDEAVPLTTKLDIKLAASREKNAAWLSLALVTGDESWDALRLEYAGGAIRYTAEDVKQYCLMEDADKMAVLYSMMLSDSEEGFEVLPLFEMLDAFLQNPQAALPEGAATADENGLLISAELQGVPISFRFVAEKAEYSDCGFDFSGLEAVPFKVKEGIFGSPVMEAINAMAAEKLMPKDVGLRKAE